MVDQLDQTTQQIVVDNKENQIDNKEEIIIMTTMILEVNRCMKIKMTLETILKMKLKKFIMMRINIESDDI